MEHKTANPAFTEFRSPDKSVDSARPSISGASKRSAASSIDVQSQCTLFDPEEQAEWETKASVEMQRLSINSKRLRTSEFPEANATPASSSQYSSPVAPSSSQYPPGCFFDHAQAQAPSLFHATAPVQAIFVPVPVPVVQVVCPEPPIYVSCDAHGTATVKRVPVSAVKKTSNKEREVQQAKVDKQPPPEASPAEWIARAKKRQQAVDNMKESPVYTNNQDVEQWHRPVFSRPRTPDPHEKLAKRDWEENVASWRSDWRRIDGVQKLTSMGYEEKQSRAAWDIAKKSEKVPQDQEEHLALAQAVLESLTPWVPWQ
jgi:hypothetical protein